MIGVPISTTWPSCRPTTSAAMDADILVALKEEHEPTHRLHAAHPRGAGQGVPRTRSSTSSRPTSSARCSTSACRRRSTCRSRAPNLDKVVRGRASACATRCAPFPGTADVHIAQVLDYPTLKLDVDRAARGAARAVAARRRQQLLIVAVVELAGRAVVLPESAQQRQLPRRGQDAAGQDALGARTCLATLADRARGALFETSGDGLDVASIAVGAGAHALATSSSAAPESRPESAHALHGAARARRRCQRRGARPGIGGRATSRSGSTRSAKRCPRA